MVWHGALLIMSAPAMDEIHVLEETLNRVTSLTNNILNNINTLQNLSKSTRNALARSYTSSDTNIKTKENVYLLVQQFQIIDEIVNEVQKLKMRIGVPPQVSNIQEYIKAVQTAFNLSKTVMSTPPLSNFEGLVKSTKQIYQQGVQNLVKFFKSLALSIYEPQEGDQLIESQISVGDFDYEELQLLKNVLHGIYSFRGVEDTVNTQLGAIFEMFVNKTLNFNPLKLPLEKQQRYNKLLGNLEQVLINSVLLIFDASERRKLFSMFVRELIASKQVHVDAKAKAATSTPNTPSAPNKPGVPSKAIDSTPSTPSAAADGTATTGTATSAGPTGTTTGTTGPSAPSPGPGPGIGGPDGPSPSPSPVAGDLTNWSVFDLLLSPTLNDHQQTQYKTTAIQLLKKQINDISAVCVKSPLTSEFSVSPASLQFMKFLSTVAEHSKGVELLLSELPVRAYLPTPPPIWSQQKLTAMARADPLSLYFSDMAECFYFNLHNIAQTQLQSTTRIGLFMLLNLINVEHFITDSKTETLSTMKRPSMLAETMRPVAIKQFQRLFLLSIKEYLVDWSKLASVLVEPTVTSTAGSAKLSNKDREVVKDKFKKFNLEFEALIERSQRANIPDQTLKLRVRQEISSILKPMYFKFYDKHSSGDFTKNLKKYVKFDKQEFERLLQSI